MPAVARQRPALLGATEPRTGGGRGVEGAADPQRPALLGATEPRTGSGRGVEGVADPRRPVLQPQRPLK